MRHAKVGRRLSRSASHRKALLAALSTALIKHKRIRTTSAKAKETRRIIEPLITRARDAYLREKSGEPVDVHARREIARFIRDKEALQILFSEVAEKVGKRAGGYTRVLKLGHRLGDGAEMAVIELVDYNEAQDSKQRKERAARSKAAAQRRKAAEERKAKAGKEETEPQDEATEEEDASAAEKVAEKAGEAAAAAEAAVDQTADAVEDAVEATKETASEVAEKTEEVVDKAADAVEEKVEDVKEAAADAAENVKENVKDVLPGDEKESPDDSASEEEDKKKS